MAMLQCSIHHCWCFVPAPLGVQSSFNASNCRAVAVYYSFAAQKQLCNEHRPWKKLLGTAGRMCEVGPPVNGCSFFNVPHSHLRCSTEILPYGADKPCRLELGEGSVW